MSLRVDAALILTSSQTVKITKNLHARSGLLQKVKLYDIVVMAEEGGCHHVHLSGLEHSLRTWN